MQNRKLKISTLKLGGFNDKKNKEVCLPEQKSNVLKCGSDLIVWLTNLRNSYYSDTDNLKNLLFQDQEK